MKLFFPFPVLCRRYFTGLLLAVTVSGFGGNANAETPARPQVRLVLQITVDGLRGDLIRRYEAGFVQGGFQRLMNSGLVYSNAHYQHANTETIVGHTTLATGAFPSRHGMVGNVWFDRENSELAYNIEDAAYPLLTTDMDAKRADANHGAQVDPAQKQARTKGRSPAAILAPTLADTLAAYYGGRSRIFAISGKDRSAVAMAGKTGKAFWFSTDTGEFITSSYYYDHYPVWVSEWNAAGQADGYANQSWNLLNESSTYLLIEQDNRPYEADLRGYGRVFPHPFGRLDDGLFYTRLLVSPVADKMSTDFAKTLIRNEKLGQDDIPDYLSISFSGVDAVNHFFGPSSLENEDVVKQLDHTLADFFAFIDDTIGLEQVLVVLAADHGMAEMPEYMSDLGFAAGRLDEDEIIKVANQAGQNLGVDDIVRFFYRPYLYLDDAKIAAAKLDLAAVQQSIAGALNVIEGLSLAAPSSELNMQTVNPLFEPVRRNFHPSRSGDIYIIQKPYWFLFAKGPIRVMHGSPWRYDTHIPVIFMGPGIPSKTVSRLIHPIDVAPSIAGFLGMSPPAAANGSVLPEILTSRAKLH